ncbi:hypothetical protein M6D81_29030 [Paenibacillus sp. J5C_2022]|uniref:ligand-binding sensor domain-containing protein n=1 Tax=Paenibacillus sp. J5C2022 TaxID=2977129 RepID=UPI0021CEAD85|nr:hypothetical protein [Paenibacillus sp. J5C2022]MCU6712752.1 hypothetical protein [Paenibacillus sp. J5C2022]
MSLCKSSLTLGKYPMKERKFYTVKDGLPHDEALSIAVSEQGVPWASTAGGLVRFDGERFVDASPPDADGGTVFHLLFRDSIDRLWAASESALYCLCEGSWAISSIPGSVLALDEDNQGTLWASTSEALYALRGAEWTRIARMSNAATSLAAFGDGHVFAGTADGLLALDGKRPHWFHISSAASGLVSDNIRAMTVDAWGHIWAATDKGVAVYDHRQHWFVLDDRHGLPCCDCTDIRLGNDGSVYIGTSGGLVHLLEGRMKFYGYKRWLPDQKVRSIALSPVDGTVWVATPAGISRISTRSMTLEEKAVHFNEQVEHYHTRRGYVTIRLLSEEGNLGSGEVEISDNDGLWTANYAAAQSFRYAVTGEEEAKRLAWRSIEAMLKLTGITDIPGFTARAIRHRTESQFGNGRAEWHLTEDGEWEWKGETSSDEMVGHFYAYSLYYDLAADEAQKEEIRRAVKGIADHILGNGYQLIDKDGERTTWAVWGPDQLNREDKWREQRGVNSLELLSHLKAAAYMTGEAAYEEAYCELIKEHHYAMNTMRQKIEQRLSHIDDNLAFLSYVPLLRYERDPQLRSMYLMGLEHHWQHERAERTPLWNIIYGALTGRACELEAAVQSMAELPLDLIHWPVVNSHRCDLKWDEELERSGYKQLKEPLPYDEKPLSKYDSNPYLADRGNGMRAEDGTLFLHPYWMARYFGLIKEE